MKIVDYLLCFALICSLPNQNVCLENEEKKRSSIDAENGDLKQRIFPGLQFSLADEEKRLEQRLSPAVLASLTGLEQQRLSPETLADFSVNADERFDPAIIEYLSDDTKKRIDPALLTSLTGNAEERSAPTVF